MKILVAMMLLMACTASAVAQQPESEPENHPTRTSITRNSINADLSQGNAFTFRIAPSLPAFTFKLVPLQQPPDEFGNAQSTIRDIQVFRADSDKMLQHLTGCNTTEMQPPPNNGKWFHTDDFNFDGYQDVFLLTAWGATGNQYGCVWLYNPTSGTFEYSEDFSKLSRYWLDSATKTIFTFGRGGMLGFVHTAERYAVENNHPVLVWSENQDWDVSKNQFHCIVKERRGADMAVTRDVWSKADDENPPCNPSVLFKHLKR
jgi:hypothetical protein